MSKQNVYAKVHVTVFATIAAVMWSAAIVVLGLISWIFAWGIPMADVLASVYLGFKPGIVGLIFGVLWGFPSAWLFAAVGAWLYNFVIKYYIIYNENADDEDDGGTAQENKDADTQDGVKHKNIAAEETADSKEN